MHFRAVNRVSKQVVTNIESVLIDDVEVPAGYKVSKEASTMNIYL